MKPIVGMVEEQIGFQLVFRYKNHFNMVLFINNLINFLWIK
jgi:hypothetical protein